MSGVNPETGLYDTDEEALAYRTGIIDARNYRPPRIDRPDHTPTANAYRHGYTQAGHR